jgi:protein-tyrosine phosphatase
MSDTWPTELTGTVNFRDLGGHATPDGPIRYGRVYRSDSLAHVVPSDVEHLVEERGVRTVVDLRGATEVDAYPNHPMRDAGATIHHIPLIDPAKRESTPGLEWETMSLVDLYRFILGSAGPQFVEVLQIIAEPANHPLVFHCAAGKDRAGLIAATVLGLLRVDDEEIVADYAQTSAALEALKARAQQRAESTGRPPADRFMTADAETMRETLTWLQAEHGGFERYMLDHGLATGEVELLRTSLIEPPVQKAGG